MTVHDLWKGLSKAEAAEKRRKNLDRWQRRWRGPEIDPQTSKPKQHKLGYKHDQKAQAYQDDAYQMGQPKARRVRRDSVTVGGLLDRHLAAKADRAPATVADYAHRAQGVRDAFGDRVVSTLDMTEIEIWSARPGVAAESRKKEVEIFRAAMKRGIRDGLVDKDLTEGIVVSLGHQEAAHWSHAELTAVLDAAGKDFDRALLGVLGLMGLRSGEARSVLVGDLRGGHLSVRNSGAGSDMTKTRASLRVLPAPDWLLPLLVDLAGTRPGNTWLFESPRRPGKPIGKRYVSDALTRAVARANQGGKEPIERINVHGLRHTFAAIALSELGADVLSVSKALGHSRPSTTLNHYGHLAPDGLAPLMAGIDGLATQEPDPR